MALKQSVSEEYLESEILTAAPQKLQLMLIGGALRHGERAKTLLADGKHQQAGEAILRCQEIVAEVLSGLNYDSNEPLVRRIAGVYNFVFRRLVSAHLKSNAAHLDDALRVLRIERETWQIVCEKLGATVAPAAAEGGEQPRGVSLEA